jgi:hypothetical protein
MIRKERSSMLSKAASGLSLPDRDYVPLALPTTDLQALDVLTRAAKVLRRYSRLDRVLIIDPAATAPLITADQPVVAASGSNHRTAKVGIGLAAVSSILQALGGKAELALKAEHAREVRYTYSDVTSDRVDLVSLDEWLTHADLRPNLRNVADLLTAQSLFVVVATLKAGGLEVELLDENSTGVHLDVAAIQDVVGANVSVSAEHSRTSRLVFSGSQPLVVAAKAAQLRIEDHGIWVNERLARHGEIRTLGNPYEFLHDVLYLA